MGIIDPRGFQEVTFERNTHFNLFDDVSNVCPKEE